MKPTFSNIEKRVEAIENHKAARDDAPSLTLIFNREDGTPGEVWHWIGAAAGAPNRLQKLTPEQWHERAQQGQTAEETTRRNPHFPR